MKKVYFLLTASFSLQHLFHLHSMSGIPAAITLRAMAGIMRLDTRVLTGVATIAIQEPETIMADKNANV